MHRFAVALLVSTAFIISPALAEEGATGGASSDADNEITVFGKGETRQVQQIQAADIQVLTPGTSPIRAIEKLPSVNIQAADPFGNYEWSTRVTIRSFNQNQLGFTFDGIPLGDMSYGNHNGLHISRVVSPENISSVRVAQGAGAITTQSSNSLGGTVETFSMDSQPRTGATLSGTYGSNSTARGFARLELGNDEGARGFVSYAYTTTDKYRGEGKQFQHLINAKITVPIGASAISAWFSRSQRREQDYQDMSLDMLNRLGYSWDNTFPDYARAIHYADIGNNRGETGAAISNAAAGSVYPGNVTTVDDAYYDASGLRDDTVASLSIKAPIGETGHFNASWYYHKNKGMGLWATPYIASPNGTPISVRTTEYDIDRTGFFGSYDFTAGFNQITVGGWWEHNAFNQARRFYALSSRTSPGLNFREFPSSPFFTQWEFNFKTETLQYYVTDEMDFGALKVNIGWKGFRVENKAEAVVQGSFPQGTIQAKDLFQPHVGMTYAVSDKAEVFAGYTQATRAFASATTTGPFSTTQAGFNAISSTLKPESADTYELGARYNSSVFNGVIGVYLVNFRDRLLSVASGASIVGSPSVLQNVGDVRSVGFEAAGDLKLGGGLSVFASYSYTDATYRDNVLDRTGALIAAISGKTVVDSPKHMIRGEIAYDNGPIFGRIGANYMSKRYFTYTNDRSVPARTIVDASLGYRFTDKIELQANVTNLFDKQYIATVGSGGFGNSGDRQTLLVGAPQQFFVTLKAGF